MCDTESQGQEHQWRVPGAAQTSLDGQLAPKQHSRLPARAASAYQASRGRRRTTAPAKPNRREADQGHSRGSSQERAERGAAQRAAKKAAQVAALEREWRVQQVAGELGRQAELLERHRYLVSKYGTSDAVDQSYRQGPSARQVNFQLEFADFVIILCRKGNAAYS